MPKRTDIETIFIIGSGPIVIGQACEFGYSGTQACKTLLAEGYRVVLVNSNPATIMTDPEFATRTYIEPLRADILEKIITKEKPDALLPTLGGQTGLNLAVELFDSGILDKYGVEMIGARGEVMKKAKTASASSNCSTRSACASRPAARRPASNRPSASRTRSATRSSSARRSCWAGARCRSSTARTASSST